MLNRGESERRPVRHLTLPSRTTMATIMDEDVQWNGDTETDTGRQVDDQYRPHLVGQGAAPRTKGRSQLMRQMMKNDWISNIWVMVGVGKSSPARELSDTQSDFNFVSYHFLVDAGADLRKVELASTEEIYGIVQGATFTPSHQIELEWVREKGRKMHRGTFFIVDHPDDRGEARKDSALPDFDVIVSRAETASYFRYALTAASRKKTEGKSLSQ